MEKQSICVQSLQLWKLCRQPKNIFAKVLQKNKVSYPCRGKKNNWIFGSLGLMKQCVIYLSGQLTTENVLQIYQRCRFYIPTNFDQPSAPLLEEIDLEPSPMKISLENQSIANQARLNWCSYLMNSCLEFIEENASIILSSEVGALSIILILISAYLLKRFIFLIRNLKSWMSNQSILLWREMDCTSSMKLKCWLHYCAGQFSNVADVKWTIR